MLLRPLQFPDPERIVLLEGINPRPNHELGVRMALGAQIVDVLKLVLQRAMLLAIAGIGIGVIGAAALTRYMTTLLFGVKPIDTMTFVGVALVLAAVVFVACLVPARRAAKIDPLEALR